MSQIDTIWKESPMVSDKFDMRAQNESMLLKKIIDEKIISRAELSKVTGLNKASVSAITKELVDANFIQETGIGDSSSMGGRKPVLLEFNPQVATVLSIDVGTNYIFGVHCYLDGEEIAWSRIDDQAISKTNILESIEQILSDLKIDRDSQVVGLSIAIHGIVFENQIKFTPNYDLVDFDLHGSLSKMYDFPIFIENEANLAALGAYSFGNDSHHIIALSIHSGIGAGIVIDGLLLKGQEGEAGEIGHSILFPDGKACPCGNAGCLEQYASTDVLFAELKQALQLEKLSLQTIKAELAAKNPAVLAIIDRNAYYLSIGINNISTIFNQQTLIINSPLYNEVPELIDLITEKLHGRISKKTNIIASTVGERAIVYGGVALACQNFLNINKLKFV